MTSRRWCFTLNNFTNGEYELIKQNLATTKYGVIGKETGEGGTPHLQGFVIFETSKRLNAVKRFLSNRAHVEQARGTSNQAATYCKKEGSFEEFGELPNSQGKRSDIEKFKEWIMEFQGVISEQDVASEFPSIYLRYRASAMSMVRLLAAKPILVRGGLRQWQQRLHDQLDGEPDDRTINFYVDADGGKGKSWFIRYYISNYPEKTQRLSIGKRDDLAYVLDPSKRVFLFDIPRNSMQYLQYNILEQLKDQMVFSPKYESTSKIFPNKVHVVVFSNEEPDREQMTNDRYNITHLRSI